jgi:hypothetical protein
MLALIALMLAQAPPADMCHRYTKADVAAVLGATPDKPGTPTGTAGCTWTAAGLTLMVSSTDVHDPGAAAALVGASKTGASKSGDKITEERGIGGDAVSIAASNGHSIQLLRPVGSVIWRFSVDSPAKPLNVDATLTHLRTLVLKGA